MASRALEQLRRVDGALSTWTDGDRVSITPAGRVRLAKMHLVDVLNEFRVSERMADLIEKATEPFSPEMEEHWQQVKASAAQVMADGQDGYVGDAEHMTEYCRLLVVTLSAKQAALPEEETAPLERAAEAYLKRHLRANDDYAPHLTDTKARVLAGCALTLQHGNQLDQWLADIDVFAAKVARHEYSRADAVAVHSLLMRVIDKWNSETDDTSQRKLIQEVRAEFGKVLRAADRHSLGPAHLEALEHQWRTYKMCMDVAPHIRDNAIGAMQETTVRSLRTADTFCWAPQTTQAVMAAADGLPVECTPSVSALGDLAQARRSGWWWFQEPVPVQTTGSPGAEQPVVALLWNYGLQFNPPPPDFPHLRMEPRVGLWFQTCVMHRDDRGGRVQDVAVPTTAWIWHDGVPLSSLRGSLEREYRRCYDQGRMGFDACGIDETVAASLAFSRFFMAAAAWLRQRIVVESHGGQGIRQAARQIQRQHKLEETPRVRVVELRRSEYVRRESAPATEGSGRKLSVRFVVKGFWRNQWYATRQEHAPKYIESHLRGPADAPLKTAPTVYVVRR